MQYGYVFFHIFFLVWFSIYLFVFGFNEQTSKTKSNTRELCFKTIYTLLQIRVTRFSCFVSEWVCWCLSNQTAVLSVFVCWSVKVRLFRANCMFCYRFFCFVLLGKWGRTITTRKIESDRWSIPGFCSRFDLKVYTVWKKSFKINTA